MHSADTVPMAAPSTERPAPGMVNAVPRMLTVRVGKMRKELNTTSSDIITTLITLGTTMLPLLRSIPEPKMENWNAGIPMAMMAK